MSERLPAHMPVRRMRLAAPLDGAHRLRVYTMQHLGDRGLLAGIRAGALGRTHWQCKAAVHRSSCWKPTRLPVNTTSSRARQSAPNVLLLRRRGLQRGKRRQVLHGHAAPYLPAVGRWRPYRRKWRAALTTRLAPTAACTSNALLSGGGQIPEQVRAACSGVTGCTRCPLMPPHRHSIVLLSVSDFQSGTVTGGHEARHAIWQQPTGVAPLLLEQHLLQSHKDASAWHHTNCCLVARP